MKKNYFISLVALTGLLIGSSVKAQIAYWTQQYNQLPILYDVTGIIGYGPNIVLGGTPYYTHTVSTAFDPSTSGHRVYRFVKVNSLLFGVGDSAILKSHDDGVTWDTTTLSKPWYDISSECRMSYDGTRLYVWDPSNTNFGNVLQTTDTGNTWTSTGYQQPDGIAFLVYNGIAYASSLTGLQYSTDNGQNWHYVTTIGSVVNDVEVFNDTVYVATNMGVYKGTGDPAQWIGTITKNSLCLCNTGLSLLCGTQQDGVWQSNAVGTAWFSKSDDLPYTGSGVLRPVTELSYNDFYVMANVRFDTTGVVHYLYTMPIAALSISSGNVALDQLQVYPNPARDVLYINTGKSSTGFKVVLMDLNGRMVAQQSYNNASTMQLVLPNLAAGFYVLNVSDGNSSVSKKIEITKP
jgi:hypothetical protein